MADRDETLAVSLVGDSTSWSIHWHTGCTGAVNGPDGQDLPQESRRIDILSPRDH